MSRVKQPNNDPRWRTHREWIQQRTDLRAQFDWEFAAGATQTVSIVPGGATPYERDAVRVPFWWQVSDGDTPVPWMAEDSGGSIDLSASSGALGGILDSNFNVATDTDYLVFAFLDAVNGSITGYGCIPRPRSVSASTSSGGGLGAPATFATGTNGDGFLFTVGQRIMVRSGTTGFTNSGAGSSYNQGTITEVTATSITATMDAAYGGTDPNVSLAAGTGLEIYALDMPEPRIFSTSEYSTFSVSGVELPFAYLGMIQTDGSSNVKHTRAPGDPYWYASGFTALLRTGRTAAENAQLCLARWLPFGTDTGYFNAVSTITAGTPGRAIAEVATDSAASALVSSRSHDSTGLASTDIGAVPIRVRECTAYVALSENGTLTMDWSVGLLGYIETRM